MLPHAENMQTLAATVDMRVDANTRMVEAMRGIVSGGGDAAMTAFVAAAKLHHDAEKIARKVRYS